MGRRRVPSRLPAVVPRKTPCNSVAEYSLFHFYSSYYLFFYWCRDFIFLFSYLFRLIILHFSYYVTFFFFFLTLWRSHPGPNGTRRKRRQRAGEGARGAGWHPAPCRAGEGQNRASIRAGPFVNPRVWPSHRRRPVVITLAGLRRRGYGSRWQTGPTRFCELLESPGLNSDLRALNSPFFPSGAVVGRTVRLFRCFSMMRQRGEGEPGIASSEAGGEMKGGGGRLMERQKRFNPRSGGFNGKRKGKKFPTDGKEGIGSGAGAP